MVTLASGVPKDTSGSPLVIVTVKFSGSSKIESSSMVILTHALDIESVKDNRYFPALKSSGAVEEKKIDEYFLKRV